MACGGRVAALPPRRGGARMRPWPVVPSALEAVCAGIQPAVCVLSPRDSSEGLVAGRGRACFGEELGDSLEIAPAALAARYGADCELTARDRSRVDLVGGDLSEAIFPLAPSRGARASSEKDVRRANLQSVRSADRFVVAWATLGPKACPFAQGAIDKRDGHCKRGRAFRAERSPLPRALCGLWSGVCLASPAVPCGTF